MAIGERIHHFRLLRGFTQKYLGQQLGFSESQADVRIAQYEKGARSPKENYLNALADIFDVSPHALAVPDIDSPSRYGCAWYASSALPAQSA